MPLTLLHYIIDYYYAIDYDFIAIILPYFIDIILTH
jgi:hypothetical protein